MTWKKAFATGFDSVQYGHEAEPPVFNVFTVSKFLFKKDDEYANRYTYLALYLYRLESEVRSLKEFVFHNHTPADESYRKQ
jgi:hypothetical protein